MTSDPSPHYQCPECHCRNTRIAAELPVIFRPNDPDEPFENHVFCASNAWCERCDWHGQAGDLFKLPELELIS